MADIEEELELIQGEDYNEAKYEIPLEVPKKENIKDIIDQEKSNNTLDNLYGWILDNKFWISISSGLVLVTILTFIIIMVISNKSKAIENKNSSESTNIYTSETDFYVPFRYNDEDYEKLRAAGYTAIEIEAFEENQADIEEKLEIASNTKREWATEQFRSLIRNSAESTDLQYAYLMSNTYLGLEPQELNKESKKYNVTVYKENVDYWKMPMQGYQPTIKIRLKSGEILYYQISPSRYIELSESGNITIQYDVYEMYDCKFIVNIKEQQI